MIDEKGIKIGDYVLVTRWSYADPNDPWYVGFLKEMGEDCTGNFYRVDDGLINRRYWRHCMVITKQDAEEIFEDMESWVHKK